MYLPRASCATAARRSPLSPSPEASEFSRGIVLAVFWVNTAGKSVNTPVFKRASTMRRIDATKQHDRAPCPFSGHSKRFHPRHVGCESCRHDHAWRGSPVFDLGTDCRFQTGLAFAKIRWSVTDQRLYTVFANVCPQVGIKGFANTGVWSNLKSPEWIIGRRLSITKARAFRDRVRNRQKAHLERTSNRVARAMRHHGYASRDGRVRHLARGDIGRECTRIDRRAKLSE